METCTGYFTYDRVPCAEAVTVTESVTETVTVAGAETVAVTEAGVVWIVFVI